MDFNKPFIFVGTILCFCICVGVGIESGSKAAEEATYTQKEVAALHKLKKAIQQTPQISEPYQRRDEYLIRWLRARELKVSDAKAMLLRNLAWREAEGMDGILDEKMPAPFNAQQLPYDLQSVDREGRPVLIINFVKWDIRKIVLAGKLQAHLRYMAKVLFEEPSVKARAAGLATGTNSTQYYVLVDLAGYSLRQHACLQCLRIFFFYMETYENYYPQLVKETIFINTPKIFDSIIKMTKSLWSSHLTDHVMFLGYDRKEWMRRIGQFIAPEQLPKQFGGTNPRKLQK